MDISEMKPGTQIEILASKDFGKERWIKYVVSDWETAQVSADGRWLFHATSEYQGTPCPMIVDQSRIRLAVHIPQPNPGKCHCGEVTDEGEWCIACVEGYRGEDQ